MEKDVKTLGSESLSTLCYFLGWVGQPQGNWPPKGKFPKEELDIQQITRHCGGRCMALNGTGPQSWVVLAPRLSTASWCSVLTSRNNFQTPVLHLPSTGTEAERTERSWCQARATTGAKVAVIGAFRKSQLWWLSCLVTLFIYLLFWRIIHHSISVSLRWRDQLFIKNIRKVSSLLQNERWNMFFLKYERF